MPILKHQLILHTDIVSQFELDKLDTPYEHRVGFSWYLCPARVAGELGWLLVNVEFGYCDFGESGSPADIEQSVLDAIECHLPDDRDDDNVSASFDPYDITWHTATKMPEHVVKRFQQATNRSAGTRIAGTLRMKSSGSTLNR